MKRWLLWLSVGIVALTGCATTPTDSSEYGFANLSVEDHTTPAVSPLPLGQRPRAMELHTDAGALLCFDRANALQLLAQREAAEVNQRIAGELSLAIEALRDERRALIEAGRACDLRAQMLEAAIDAERAQHASDNFWHRVGLGALLILLAL